MALADPGPDRWPGAPRRPADPERVDAEGSPCHHRRAMGRCRRRCSARAPAHRRCIGHPGSKKESGREGLLPSPRSWPSSCSSPSSAWPSRGHLRRLQHLGRRRDRPRRRSACSWSIAAWSGVIRATGLVGSARPRAQRRDEVAVGRRRPEPEAIARPRRQRRLEVRRAERPPGAAAKTSIGVPSRITRPARMTTTRSNASATNRMSWLMAMTSGRPRRPRRSRGRARRRPRPARWSARRGRGPGVSIARTDASASSLRRAPPRS